MDFWRKESFETLVDTASAAAAVPQWRGYAEYCELLGRGLRKPALAHLSEFTEAAKGWSFDERKSFVSWLYERAYNRPDNDSLYAAQLRPHPLYEKLIKPTLEEWLDREPKNGTPHRWLGTYEHLKQALRLNPDDQIARHRFIRTAVGSVGFSTHELPYGYIGSPSEDLILLDEAEQALHLIDDHFKSEYASWIKEERDAIAAYLERIR